MVPAILPFFVQPNLFYISKAGLLTPILTPFDLLDGIKRLYSELKKALDKLKTHSVNS